MKLDQIRTTLRGARASGLDDHDPEIVAARQALVGHPELTEELEAERQLDLMIARELQSTEPPAGLEEQLLETLRSVRSRASAETIPFPSKRAETVNRRQVLGGLAAMLALSASGGFLWHRSSLLPFDQLVQHLTRISSDGVTLSLMSMEKDEVASWMTDHQAPRTAAMPLELDALPRKGCHIYEIEKKTVSLECFLLPGMRELHLFSTPSSGLSGEPLPTEPIAIREVIGLTAAVWSDEHHTMALITDVPATEIRPLLSKI